MKVSALWYKILIFFFLLPLFICWRKFQTFNLIKAMKSWPKKQIICCLHTRETLNMGKEKNLHTHKALPVLVRAREGNRIKIQRGCSHLFGNNKRWIWGRGKGLHDAFRWLPPAFPTPAKPQQTLAQLPRCCYSPMQMGRVCGRDWLQGAHANHSNNKKNYLVFYFFLVWKQLKFP